MAKLTVLAGSLASCTGTSCVFANEAPIHAMEDQVVHDRWGQLGFENLLREEQDYIMIWWLVAEVFNGTFAQYFSNETGDHAPQASIPISLSTITPAERSRSFTSSAPVTPQDLLATIYRVNGAVVVHILAAKHPRSQKPGTPSRGSWAGSCGTARAR